MGSEHLRLLHLGAGVVLRGVDAPLPGLRESQFLDEPEDPGPVRTGVPGFPGVLEGVANGASKLPRDRVPGVGVAPGRSGSRGGLGGSNRHGSVPHATTVESFVAPADRSAAPFPTVSSQDQEKSTADLLLVLSGLPSGSDTKFLVAEVGVHGGHPLTESGQGSRGYRKETSVWVSGVVAQGVPAHVHLTSSETSGLTEVLRRGFAAYPHPQNSQNQEYSA